LAGSSSLSTRAKNQENRILIWVKKDIRNMEKVKDYILDSIEEVRNKVSWPKFNELQSSAILVLVASLIFALVIGLIDLGFKNALAWFYREF
jgi:preprotein translocase subunit SecE